MINKAEIKIATKERVNLNEDETVTVNWLVVLFWLSLRTWAWIAVNKVPLIVNSRSSGEVVYEDTPPFSTSFISETAIFLLVGTSVVLVAPESSRLLEKQVVAAASKVDLQLGLFGQGSFS